MRQIIGLAFAGIFWLAGLTGCKPKEVALLNKAEASLYPILAAEATQVAGAKKQVVLVALAGPDGKPSALAKETEAALKSKNLSPVIKVVSLGDPMRYGSYGWSAASFQEVLQQHAEAGAVVSLVGAPLLKGADLGKVPAAHPPVLVVSVAQVGLNPGVSSDLELLGQLLERKVLHLAIIQGQESAAEGKTPEQKLFGQHYMRLRAAP